jgi:hypothetical protein
MPLTRARGDRDRRDLAEDAFADEQDWIGQLLRLLEPSAKIDAANDMSVAHEIPPSAAGRGWTRPHQFRKNRLAARLALLRVRIAAMSLQMIAMNLCSVAGAERFPDGGRVVLRR